MVADYARRGVEMDVNQVVLTASSSESYALLFKLLGDPGQSVLCPEPSYPLFEYLARLESLTPRPYRLGFDGRWHIDFDSLDLTDAAAIIVVSPNNPTGSFVSGEDFDRLAGLAAEHGLALIVDEVFADFPLAPAADAVIAVAGRPSPALVFSLGGLSKSCGLPHLKLGWIAATGPAALVQRCTGAPGIDCRHVFVSGNAGTDGLARTVAGWCGDSPPDSRTRAAQSAHLGRGPGRRIRPARSCPPRLAGAAILRVPEIMSDEAWASTLLEKDGVLVQPGYFFDLAMGATLVLSLIVQEQVFAEGVARLLARVAAR